MTQKGYKRGLGLINDDVTIHSKEYLSPESMTTSQMKAWLTKRGLVAEGTRSRLIGRMYEAMHMTGGAGGNTCAVPCKKDGSIKWWARDWYTAQQEKRKKAAAIQASKDPNKKELLERLSKRAVEKASYQKAKAEWLSKRVLVALSAIPEDFQPRRILHIGCGDGQATLTLMKALKERSTIEEELELVAIDRNPDKMQQSEILFDTLPEEDKAGCRVTLIEDNAESLRGVGRKSFDLVVAVDCLHVSDIDEVTRRVSEKLSVGGRFVCLTWAEGAFKDTFEGVKRAMAARKLNPDMVDVTYSFLTEARATALISECGLEPVHIEVRDEVMVVHPPVAPWLVNIARPYIMNFMDDPDWLQEFCLDVKAELAPKLFVKKPEKEWRLDLRTAIMVATKKGKPSPSQ